MRDWSGGEGFDVSFGAPLVGLFVPTGEGGKEDKANEGEYYGDDSGSKTVSMWSIDCISMARMNQGSGALTLGMETRCCP